MVESNISESPFLEQTLSEESEESRSSRKFFCFCSKYEVTLSSISAEMICLTPFVSRKSREISTIALPLNSIFMRAVVRDDGNGSRGKVFLGGKADKLLFVLGSHDDSHALLRFGNGKFRARKAFVLERHFVEIDDQPVGEFPDGDGNTARAEVVALLDLARHFLIEEQALQFALGQRIALLHFRAAGLTECASCALEEPVAPPQPSLPVSPPSRMMMSPFFGFSRYNHIPAGAADNKARFQSLCLVPGMIYFVYDPRRKADLVAVRGEASRSRLGDDALRKFSGESILYLSRGSALPVIRIA